MMIAFGIQLSIDSGKNGVVTFEAKTDELARHYISDFWCGPHFLKAVWRSYYVDDRG